MFRKRKIKSITKNEGLRDVYDISVKDAKHYILGNGVISHNSGPKYGSSIIISMTKSAEKKSASDKTVIGTGVRCVNYKNRFAREKASVKVVINFDKGLSRYSGLFPLAVELGYINQVAKGSQYYIIKGDTEKHRSSWFAGNCEFWDKQLKGNFGNALNNMFRYQSSTDGIFDDSELEVIDNGEEDGSAEITRDGK